MQLNAFCCKCLYINDLRLARRHKSLNINNLRKVSGKIKPLPEGRGMTQLLTPQPIRSLPLPRQEHSRHDCER